MPQECDQSCRARVPEPDVEAPKSVAHHSRVHAVQQTDGSTEIQRRPVRRINRHACLRSRPDSGWSRSTGAGEGWITSGRRGSGSCIVARTFLP